MQGGAVTLARLADERDLRADLILVSDMVNLATFRALTSHRFHDTPIALYFHETQLTYPQNARQAHGWRYGFINYISAMAADHAFFNSHYHMEAFFTTLPNMLKHFGDFNELQTVDSLREKSSVLELGLDLRRFDPYRGSKEDGTGAPLIIWNHRWEEDKNPQAFFYALYKLMDWGTPFRVAITGENFGKESDEFEQARKRLGDRISTYGYIENFSDYARLLWEADHVVSTANQEFFGGSVAEAIYCGCIPILPERLNYPALVPPEHHSACLYAGESLYHRLREHLLGEYDINTEGLRQHVIQYDWQQMAPRYDDALSNLVSF